MSLQVASGVAVGVYASIIDDRTGMPTRPDPVRVEARRSNPILTLTCRDVFDEARQRLARKQYHWE